MHWNKRLAEADMDASVGSVGDSCDNALAETISGLYKTEVIRRRGPWKNMEEVEYATLEWVDWFNNRRLLEPIINVPPTEYEMMYYRQLEESAMVARLKLPSLQNSRGDSSKKFALACIAVDDAFPEALELVRSWLRRLQCPGRIVSALHKAELDTRHPEPTLDLLHRVVADEVQGTCPDLSSCLDAIRVKQPELEHDPRFQRLLKIVQEMMLR